MAETRFSECLIYWYSGTGNSFLVAERIADTIAADGLSVSMVQIKKNLIPIIPENALIGLVFPIAASGTYPFIWDFFKRLPPADNKIFMADTLGGFSGGIKGPLGRCLDAKGYQRIGAIEIVMPENFPPGRKSSGRQAAKRIEPGLEKAEDFAKNLLHGETSWKDIPVVSELLGAVCRFKSPWQLMRRIFAFGIVAEKCSRCGLCVKLCPVNNIESTGDGVPVFKNGCQICMRCIAYCPERAILSKYGQGLDYRAVSAEKLLIDWRKI
jgi:Pyruvate/2-oxoacid:ferredoxin oxidoreductase delta subunit/flavodoxin